MATRPVFSPSSMASVVGAVLAGIVLSGCSLFSAPTPTPVDQPSLAPPGAVGYVVCPNAVTPVELSTRTAEPGIELPVSGSSGDSAIATSADGRFAYVVTSSVAGNGLRNAVIPINLATQRALTPIEIPGQGGTHAIVVLPGNRTVLAGSGNTVVPVDVSSRRVGTPLDLGGKSTVFGMALDPTRAKVYALVAGGGVIPISIAHSGVVGTAGNTVTASVEMTAGPTLHTGLSVSSVDSPHGIVVTPNGSTIYVVGQGGGDFGGRVLPILTVDGAMLPAASLDHFGISDPGAVAVDASGDQLLVADAADNWIVPVPVATFPQTSQPVPLPEHPAGGSGTGHPTDVVFGPAGTGAFVVDGFDTVMPYQPGSRSFGRPIQVCPGASSMAVAPSP
jgi:DNA-binding beta-propeller fold protein YncE